MNDGGFHPAIGWNLLFINNIILKHKAECGAEALNQQSPLILSLHSNDVAP
jgi:hypothetical protein